MAQLRRDLDLAQEAIGAQRFGEIGAHDLHRHLAMVLEVFGQIHRRHPALAEDVLDPVVVSERLAHLVDLHHPSGHGAARHSRLGGVGVPHLGQKCVPSASGVAQLGHARGSGATGFRVVVGDRRKKR